MVLLRAAAWLGDAMRAMSEQRRPGQKPAPRDNGVVRN
jgi:hypothetical protein